MLFVARNVFTFVCYNSTMETNTDNVRLKVAKQYFVDYTKNGTGILKALSLLLPEIEKLKEQGIRNREQIAILESMFDVKINYETYRQFVYAKLKKRPPVAPEITPPVAPKKEPKTTPQVAPKEPNSLVKNINKDFVRKTKPKYNKEDF